MPERAHDPAHRFRDYATLVEQIFTRGPQTVADQIGNHVPGGTDPSSPPGHLRWLLLSRAHLLARSHDRAEVACVLYDLLAPRTPVFAWLTGVERALPPVRLTARGPEGVPEDPRLVRVLTGHRAPVRSIAWSPDGEQLATVGAYDSCVQIWRTRDWSRQERLDITGASLDEAVWSPDGHRLAVLGRSDRFPDLGEHEPDDVHGRQGRVEHVHMVLVYATATWKEIAATPTAPRWGTGDRPSLAWSPDSRTLAIGEDIGVRLWAMEAPEQPAWLGPVPDVRKILDLDWHPDGTLTALVQREQHLSGKRPTVPASMLVTWPEPNTAPHFRSWHEGLPGRPYAGLRRHPDGARACLFAGRGPDLCEPDGSGMLWQRSRFGHLGPQTRAVEWSPDGHRLAELRSRHQGWADIVLWGTERGREPSVSARIDCAPEETTALAWSPGADLLATGGVSGVRLWRPETGKPHHGSFDMRVTTPVWSPDGAHVAVLSPGLGEWFVVDARDPAEPEPFGPECPFPRRDPEKEKELVETARQEGEDHDPYTGVYGRHAPDAVSPGQELYALAGDGDPIRVFDLRGGGSRLLGKEGPGGRWMLLRFTPQADRLVSLHQRTLTRQDGGEREEELVLTLWDVATGRPSARERLWRDRTSETERVEHPRALAVGRTHLAWCGGEGTVALHDSATLKPVSRTRTTGAATGLVFSPDEDALAVVGDGGVRVVDLVEVGDRAR
ncbi:WD40 repeat domain-containing protein [Nocardiopsis kunsanensis]|nr:WD40 repeat domain-containing protein [Nocardiopsis kunsanensis]